MIARTKDFAFREDGQAQIVDEQTIASLRRVGQENRAIGRLSWPQGGSRRLPAWALTPSQQDDAGGTMPGRVHNWLWADRGTSRNPRREFYAVEKPKAYPLA